MYEYIVYFYNYYNLRSMWNRKNTVHSYNFTYYMYMYLYLLQLMNIF